MKKIMKALICEDDNSAFEKTAALSLASGLTTILSVVLQMLSTRMLSEFDFAVYRQTFLIYTTFSPFLLLGIPSGIYYIFVRNQKRIRAVVKEATSVLLLNGLLFSAFIALGGNRAIASLFENSELSITAIIIGPYTVFMSLTALVTPIFVYFNRIKFNAYYQALRALFCISLTSVAIWLFKDATAGILANVMTSVIMAVFGIWAVYVILPRENARMRGDSVRELLNISIPLGIATMLGTLNTNLDKWVVSTMLSPEIFAVFSLGAQEIPLISAITGAVTTVILVEMTTAIKDNKMSKAVELFRDSAKKTSILLLPIMVFFMVVANVFVGFLYTDKYKAAADIFRIYLLYLPLRTVFYGPMLIAMGKSKQILFRSLIELIANVILSVILVNLIGAIGAAVATIIVIYGVSLPINLVLITNKTGIKWHSLLPLRHFSKCIFWSLPGGVITAVVEMITVELGLTYIVRLVVEAIVFFLITAFFFDRNFDLEILDLIKKWVWKYTLVIKEIFKRI